GFLEIAPIDGRLVAARRQQRGLVDEVRQVGACKTNRARGNQLQIDVAGDLHSLDVDAEAIFATADVRLVDHHLAVEPAGAAERPGRLSDGSSALGRLGAPSTHNQWRRSYRRK